MGSTGQSQLEALMAGRLSAWTGLPADCDRDDVEAVLGPSEPGPDGVVLSDGAALGFRDYPPRPPIAPHGATVWLEEDGVVALRVVQPGLEASEIDALGRPELQEPSEIAPYHDQWAWPARGLTLHRDRGSGTVLHLYGYRPSDLDAYRRSWLSRIAYRRRELLS